MVRRTEHVPTCQPKWERSIGTSPFPAVRAVPPSPGHVWGLPEGADVAYAELENGDSFEAEAEDQADDAIGIVAGAVEDLRFERSAADQLQRPISPWDGGLIARAQWSSPSSRPPAKWRQTTPTSRGRTQTVSWRRTAGCPYRELYPLHMKETAIRARPRGLV